ncbi:MAG: hypothetical protein WCO04_18615, partial [Pseudomonadota bacterium]
LAAMRAPTKRLSRQSMMFVINQLSSLCVYLYRTERGFIRHGRTPVDNKASRHVLAKLRRLSLRDHGMVVPTLSAVRSKRTAQVAKT